MSPKILKFFLLALAFLLAPGLLVQSAGAQDNSSLSWDKPVSVTRPPQPRRGRVRKTPVRRVRTQPVEVAPLLTMQWRVMKVGADGVQKETNPGAVFYPGDRLRLAVKVNQPGYLTIIHQSGPDQDGTIVFPDSRINNGENYVKKNEEFVVPSSCPMGISARDCALVVTPPAGKELFTLVFSRDLISDLTLNASQAGGLKPQMMQQFKAESRQILKRGQGSGTGPYVIWVANTNAKDNEEIIETLVLNKGGAQAAR